MQKTEQEDEQQISKYIIYCNFFFAKILQMVTQNFGPEELDKASASNSTFEVNWGVCMQSRHIEENDHRRSKHVIR